MEYTENFEEEQKLIGYLLYNRYHFREPEVSDLKQLVLINVVKFKDKFDASRSTYSTYISWLTRCVVFSYLRDKNWLKHKADIVSIDTPCSTSEDESCKLSDIIPCEVDFDSNLNCQYILDVGFKIINRSHFKAFKKINSLFLMGWSIKDIKHKFGITRQAVSSQIQKFRKLLRAELIKDGYLYDNSKVKTVEIV